MRDTLANIGELYNTMNQDIDSEIKTLRGRKAKLEELLALENEVTALELRLIRSDSEFVRSCRVISETVCEHYRVPIHRLIGRSHESQIVLPRHIALYLIRKFTDAPLTAIGHVIGGRDHSSVIHARKAIENRRDTERAFDLELSTIESKCAEALRN